MSKIKVLIKRPHKAPYVTHITPTLENLQRTVGGYIETVTLGPTLVVICDEEGRLRGKPYNCTIGGVDFVGEIILCGIDGDEFDDIPSDYQTIKLAYPELWEVKRCEI